MGTATTLYNEVSLISLKILEISFRIYYTYLKPRNTRFFISKKEDHDSFKSSALQITYFPLIKKNKTNKKSRFWYKALPYPSIFLQEFAIHGPHQGITLSRKSSL